MATAHPTIPEIRAATEQKMVKSLDALKHNLARIRTGRANAGLLEQVKVEYYGSMVPISQVANVTLVDARTIGVSPWEKKMGPAIDKAIRESGLGLNPSMIGEMIRVPMPALSEERRRELGKIVRGEGEDARVSVRSLRRDANTQLKELLKAKAASEDEERRAQEDIQKLTDRYIVEVDKLLQAKEQEIMTV